jgi:2'-5' RNA ligase
LVRAFIAVDANDTNIIGKIENIIDYLKSFNIKMKFVETDNLHITLRFLGEISESDVEIIKENIINKLKCNSFNIDLKGVGAFPSPENPRVIWVGIVNGFEMLKSIKKEIDEMLIKNGFKINYEEFIPHLTIARIKFGKSNSLSKFLNEYKDIDIGSININSIKLKKSTLTKNGPIYNNLAEALCK